MIKYVDVSGVGNTGKTAVSDILRELNNYHVPEYSFEFDFFRVPGGILDLKYNLCEDWSPIRSHDAHTRFLQRLELMGGNPKWYQLLKKMEITGNRYDARFNNKFIEEGRKFADSFLRGEYLAYWPYEFLNYNFLYRFLKKLQLKTGFRLRARVPVKLVDSTNFDQKASEFVDNIFQEFRSPSGKTIVFNNAFEAYNPIRSLDILHHSRSIIVTRDPRDVYVSGQNAHKLKKEDKKLQAKENDGLNKSFLATDDLNLFIERYKLYMKNVYRGNDPRVLVLKFEDVVCNYEQTLEKIYRFLNVTTAEHITPKKFFDPQRSIKNVGIWKSFSDQDAIAQIESRLAEYVTN